ncbi:MAG: TspO/MBR family protein [Bacilli bacterium]
MRNFWKFGNIVLFVLVLCMNFFTLWGRQIGPITAEIDPLFRPADWAFSIWGLIYGSLALWLILQWSATLKNVAVVISPWFWINMIANAGWIYFYGTKAFGISVCWMLVIWLSLFFMYRELMRQQLTTRWTFPFSLYFAWISVATVANIAIWLSSIVESSLLIFTICAMIGLSVWAIIWGRLYRDIVFLSVFVWAFIALAFQQRDETVILYLTLCLILFLISTIVAVFFKKVK